MAGQGVDRREVLRVMALAAAASQFPGFSRWVFACGHQSPGGAQIRPAQYQPQFFSGHEYETIERLADLIVPSDDSPGAREAGASEFIDFMVANETDVQYNFRTGLTWLDAHSEGLFGKPFTGLDPKQQNEILEALAYQDRFQPGEQDGREFFKLMREYTLMAYYTSKVGLEQLDCPALKFYPDSPGCPHSGDPEHKHLAAALFAVGGKA
jgi:Gluconate 2-dehydrogenase subunit 3